MDGPDGKSFDFENPLQPQQLDDGSHTGLHIAQDHLRLILGKLAINTEQHSDARGVNELHSTHFHLGAPDGRIEFKAQFLFQFRSRAGIQPGDVDDDGKDSVPHGSLEFFSHESVSIPSVKLWQCQTLWDCFFSEQRFVLIQAMPDMKKETIVVLDAGTLALEDSAWEALHRMGEIRFYENTPTSEDALIHERCQGAGIVLTNKVPLRRGVLERLPSLRLVCVLATGHDIIDGEAARETGVSVRNVAGYSTTSVAQHTLALMLELTNQVGMHSAAVRDGEWVGSPHFYFCKSPMVELSGRTVGIFGFGTIGWEVARRVSAFGARILAYRRHRAPESPADFFPFGPFAWADSPEELFRKSDLISLHCPLSPETSGLICRRTLGLMKPTALLINTARGGLVVEHDLVEALQQGVIAGVALDVIEGEPMRADSPWRDEVPNLIITPHQAWASPEARRRLLDETVENIRAFHRGEARNVVNGAQPDGR